MAFALAHELKGRGTTVVSLTPGWLRSEAMLDAYQVSEANWREATKRQPHFAITESPHFVGRAVAALAQDPERARWHGQSLSSGGLAKVYFSRPHRQQARTSPIGIARGPECPIECRHEALPLDGYLDRLVV